MNKQITDSSLDAMTTAAVVAYYRQTNEAKISFAGHPPVLYKRVSDRAWNFASPPGRKKMAGRPMNIPLAITTATRYVQLTIPMKTGDRLFVYTDGIIDAPSPEGKSFGLPRLKEVLDRNAHASISETKAAVLEALYRHTQKELTHDDVTLIVMEIR